MKVNDTAPESVLEVGANIGINLRAIQRISGANLHAVEPNQTARDRLVADGVVPPGQVYDGIAEKLPVDTATIDFVFTRGVLIHIHPDNLLAACKEMFRVSKKYLLCAEYFSVRPESIPYRGHSDRLFKRDFGAFWLDNFPQLEVVEYGFEWKRVTGLDNITWWLFVKTR